MPKKLTRNLNWMSRCRTDIVFLGQDYTEIMINDIKIFMDY